MSTTVTYKGQTLTTVSNDTKTLLTEGKYLEDDLTLVDVSGGGAVLTTKNITANGTYNASSDSADGYSQVTVAVPASAVDTGTKSITSNGTHDVVGYASASVAVPNSYSAGDEGKVVSNGALVAQTSDTVTANDTYDTTLINSLTVNVSGGSTAPYTLNFPRLLIATTSYDLTFSDSHVRIERTNGQAVSVSINLTDANTSPNYCKEWFEIPTGTAVLKISNVVNNAGWEWAANFKVADSTTSLGFGTGNGTHTSGEEITVSVTSPLSVGCFFIYIAGNPAVGGYLEFDVSFTVAGGTRYF